MTFNKHPFVAVPGDHKVHVGWQQITGQLCRDVALTQKAKTIVVVEYYQGVIKENLDEMLNGGMATDLFINTTDLMWPEGKIKEIVFPDVTDDRIFGYLTRLDFECFFDPRKITKADQQIEKLQTGTVLIAGSGAALACETPDILVYADMARWEIQLRMRKHLVDNLGVHNRHTEDWMQLYKQGFFVDWRVCDRLKKKLIGRWDYVLDTNNNNEPKMVAGPAIRKGLEQALKQPFSLVPFFDPALGAASG